MVSSDCDEWMFPPDLCVDQDRNMNSSQQLNLGLSSGTGLTGSGLESGLNEFKSRVNQRLIESGERDRCSELLSNRLTDCGWKDEVIVLCKDIVRQKGVENISCDELINLVTVQARQSVPDAVKKELLIRIKSFLTKEFK